MTRPGTALYWHRQDLRLADNPALAAASEFSELIIIFIYEPCGSWPLGGASRWWLHHSLAALAARYESLGQRLILCRPAADEKGADKEDNAGLGGTTARLLERLVHDQKVSAVFWNRRYDPADRAKDETIKARLTELGTAVTSFNSHLLGEPWQHNKADGTPYKVFTPLWKRFRASYEVPLPLAAPISLPPPKATVATDQLGDWHLLPTIPWAAGFRHQPGEDGAMARLTEFFAHKLEGYDEGRDFPARDQVSGLSPHLHFGEISPRQLWLQQERQPPSKDGERFLSEVVWREFAYHLLFHYPTIDSKPWKPAFGGFPWRSVTNPEVAADLKAWQRGQTGVPMVDAGMRELWHTGMMHNRVRMVVGSFLTKNLRISWTHGAAWFWDTLLDADLAANSFNWQWVAGSGADAAPYFRIFNPVRQGERFDPDGTYVKRWLPELSGLSPKHVHAPWQAPATALDAAGVALGDNYPLPIADLKLSRAAALDAYKELSEPGTP